MSGTKTCSKCDEVKAAEMFAGLNKKCRVCINFMALCKRIAYPNKQASIRKKQYDLNREKHIARSRKNRKENPQKIITASRQYRVVNLTKIKRSTKARRDAMDQGYLRQLIAGATGVHYALVPLKLIEVKRTHLQLLRKIKELNDER